MTSFQYAFRADTSLQFEVARRLSASNWSLWRLLLIWGIAILGTFVIVVPFIAGGGLIADAIADIWGIVWLSWAVDMVSPILGWLLAMIFWVRVCPSLARRFSRNAYMDTADVAFECSPEGLNWRSGSTEMRVGWSDVRAVIEAKTAVIFNLGLMGLYVPRSAFETPAGMAAFAQACREMRDASIAVEA